MSGITTAMEREWELCAQTVRLHQAERTLQGCYHSTESRGKVKSFRPGQLRRLTIEAAQTGCGETTKGNPGTPELLSTLELWSSFSNASEQAEPGTGGWFFPHTNIRLTADS